MNLKETSQIMETITDAINKYVKDPEKKKELENKAFEIQNLDDPESKRFTEKNIHRMSGHGKEYQKHEGPFLADYPSVAVTANTNTDNLLKHLDDVAVDKAIERNRKRVYKSKKSLKEALEILESLEDQVTKKYGREFGNDKLSARGLSKHKKVRANKVEELLTAAKRNLPDEEKNSIEAIDREYDKIEARRENTKDKIGKYKTDLYTIGYGGKLRSLLDLDLSRAKDAKNGYEKATAKSIRRHNEKLSEALELMESLVSIFEINTSGINVEEIPPSTNKLKTVRKDKDTDKKIEKVSVADELFPYEGNAKEQFNQKVLATINSMIEGSATLEDLIHLVRKGAKPSKKVNEGYEVAESILSSLLEADELKAAQFVRKYAEQAVNAMEDSRRHPTDPDRKLNARVAREKYERASKATKAWENNRAAKKAQQKATNNNTTNTNNTTTNTTTPSANQTSSTTSSPNGFYSMKFTNGKPANTKPSTMYRKKLTKGANGKFKLTSVPEGYERAEEILSSLLEMHYGAPPGGKDYTLYHMINNAAWEGAGKIMKGAANYVQRKKEALQAPANAKAATQAAAKQLRGAATTLANAKRNQQKDPNNPYHKVAVGAAQKNYNQAAQQHYTAVQNRRNLNAKRFGDND